MTLPLPPEKDSMLARYAGGVLTRFSGDAALCARWEGYARVLLGQVRHLAALGGYEVASRHVIAPDGTRIGVQWNGTMNIIAIQASGLRVGAIEELTSPYLSGVHEITLWAAPPDQPIKWAGQFYPARATEAGIEREWYTYSNTVDWTEWPITDFESQIPRERFIAKTVYPTKPYKDRYAKNKNRFYPSMYTGKMRRVIQKGYGNALFSDTEPSLDTNCGLFTPSGDELDIDKQRYVIQILRDGIFAWPIEFIDEREWLTEDELTEFPNWPQDRQDRYDFGADALPDTPGLVVESWDEYEALPLADQSSYKVRLASTAAMDAVYLDDYGADKVPPSPWYSTWAFDYIGRKACAVLIGISPYTTFRLYRSYLYELGIAQDSKTRPVAATIELLREEYLLTWTTTGTPGPLSVHPLSMPTILPIAGLVFWDRPDHNYHDPQPSPRHSPVYAFYNRDNALIVLNHDYVETVSLPDEISDPWGASQWQVRQPAGETYAASYGWAIAGYGSGVFLQRDNIVRGVDCYSVDGYITPHIDSTSRFSTVENAPDGSDSEQWFLGGYGAYPPTADREGHRAYLQYLMQTYELYKSEAVTHLDHIGVPIHEREGLYYYRKIKTDLGGYTRNRQRRSETHYPGRNARFRDTIPLEIVYETSTEPCFVWGEYWLGPSSGFPLSGYATPVDVVGYPPSMSETSFYRYIGSIEATYDPPGQPEQAGVLDLTPPPHADADVWFSYQEQIYEALNGAYSGRCIAAPWPGPLYWAYDADYPIDTSYCWPQYPIQFPDMIFIGDETTDVKSKSGEIDLEAIQLG